VNGLERLLRDIDRPDLLGEGLNQAVANAIADGYPPRTNGTLSTHVDNGAASTNVETAEPPDLDELLAEPDPEYDYLVPELLERGDRVIVTAPEGGGKSTLLRQIAVQVASGIHPFTHDEMPPVRVLLVDCENSRRHVRRKLRPLRDEAGEQYRAGNLRVHVEPAGVDLLRDADAAQLRATVDSSEPELLILGPIYKLAGGDPTREEVARNVAGVLDELRAECGVALLLEAHSPYTNTNGKREIRPYGASLWSRWPEFGIHIAANGKLQHWRGARDERQWPACLRRSSPWPWMAAPDAPEGDEWKPTALMVRASRLLAERNVAGEYPTRTALVEATGGKRGYAYKAVDALVADGYADLDADGKRLIHAKEYRERVD
jgi:hypothetical protein